jgi:epoxyqueuosine reductase QueG
MEEAHRLGFGDVGFTTAEPFVSHLDYLRDHQDEYGWAERAGLDLISGTDPKAVLPTAQSIIVLLEVYAGLRDSISPLSFVTISRGIIPTVIFRTRRF